VKLKWLAQKRVDEMCVAELFHVHARTVGVIIRDDTQGSDGAENDVCNALKFINLI
jgi:hypothetical protein